MHLKRYLMVAILMVAAVSTILSPTTYACESSSVGSVLSPYWPSAIRRWESIIRQEAERRRLDPDLIAAVMWKESRGDAKAVSPVGAVGLMMVMPFEWRPSPEQLQNPWTNVFWGTRVLSTTISDGNGDLYYALAAYNGSWEKVDRESTRRYAGGVLDCYTRALAVRHGFAPDGDWIAIIAAVNDSGPRTLTVLGPQRPLARYTDRPWGQAEIPQIPDNVMPHATAASYTLGNGGEGRVYVWFVADDGTPLVSPLAEGRAGGTTHTMDVARNLGVADNPVP
ncbi:MAG: transglycosylase SLT domain-containing protein [Chloroflexi bacterium]|nr:transglycosylase SLT domain-containing protein [Chloroflexota bacterium]